MKLDSIPSGFAVRTLRLSVLRYAERFHFTPGLQPGGKVLTRFFSNRFNGFSGDIHKNR